MQTNVNTEQIPSGRLEDWDTATVVAWIQSVERFQEYGHRFQEKQVTGKDLLFMNDDNLKEVYTMKAAGPRSALLKRIESLKKVKDLFDMKLLMEIVMQKSESSWAFFHDLAIRSISESNVEKLQYLIQEGLFCEKNKVSMTSVKDNEVCVTKASHPMTKEFYNYWMQDKKFQALFSRGMFLKRLIATTDTATIESAFSNTKEALEKFKAYIPMFRLASPQVLQFVTCKAEWRNEFKQFPQTTHYSLSPVFKDRDVCHFGGHNYGITIYKIKDDHDLFNVYTNNGNTRVNGPIPYKRTKSFPLQISVFCSTFFYDPLTENLVFGDLMYVKNGIVLAEPQKTPKEIQKNIDLIIWMNYRVNDLQYERKKTKCHFEVVKGFAQGMNVMIERHRNILPTQTPEQMYDSLCSLEKKFQDSFIYFKKQVHWDIRELSQ